MLKFIIWAFTMCWIHALRQNLRLRGRCDVIRMHGFMDKLSKAFGNAFENDPEFNEKENAGVSQKKGAERDRFARKVQSTMLLNTSWNFTYTLSGIPTVDPSSDLYAPKSRMGKVNGIDVKVDLKFLDNGIVEIRESDFTVSGENGVTLGKWQLDPDGATLAVSFATVGFERTIVTKGSLQSIYGGTDTMRTSSNYFIPAGSCLLQTSIILSDMGRLIIRDGKVFGKDPQERVGKLSQGQTWKRTGVLASAEQIEQ